MRYKTKDGQDYTLPGIGMTVNGVIETGGKIENPLFELVQDEPAQPLTPTNNPTDVVQTTPSVEQPTPPLAMPPAQASPAPQVNEQKE